MALTTSPWFMLVAASAKIAGKEVKFVRTKNKGKNGESEIKKQITSSPSLIISMFMGCDLRTRKMGKKIVTGSELVPTLF